MVGVSGAAGSCPKTSSSLIYDVELSSVVPGSITREDRVVCELTNMDLAMKLHYIKGVYFFNGGAARGLTISDLKLPMFRLLELYYPISGRIRKRAAAAGGAGGDGGGGGGGMRPFIKCNDSGVRIVEAKCGKTIDECLAASFNDSNYSYYDQLIAYNHVLGPDLGFAPLVLVQFTRFKCGGISVGLSWAHVLGDAFSASEFINMWALILAGHHVNPPKFLDNNNNPMITTKLNLQSSLSLDQNPPSALKRTGPVGDYWAVASKCRMQKHTFQIDSKKMNHLLCKISDGSAQSDKKVVKPFELISAIVWKALAKIRGGIEPRTVTICTQNSTDDKDEDCLSSNSQVISSLKLSENYNVSEADPLDLARILGENSVSETREIEELVEKQTGDDFVVYGANLTFVKLEEAKIYGLELNGERPVFAEYSIDGVAEEGAVLVLPGPEQKSSMEGNGNGRVVCVILPEDQIAGLRDELSKDWNLC